MNDEVKDVILSVFEASLDAATPRGPSPPSGLKPSPSEPRRRKGLSQVDMAFDILKKARAPLHVSQILDRIQTHFGVTIDRESLVSSLTKKVARGDRFLRRKEHLLVAPGGPMSLLSEFLAIAEDWRCVFPPAAHGSSAVCGKRSVPWSAWAGAA